MNQFTTEEKAIANSLGHAIMEFMAMMDKRKASIACVPKEVSTTITPQPAAITAKNEIPMLMSMREAAKILAISDRTLWALTKPRGPIPSVKLGRSVKYSPDDLREFIKNSKQSNR